MLPARIKIPFYAWPIAVALFVAIGYTILWHKAADGMEQYVDEWIADQRKSGLVIEHNEKRTHGFPFFLRTSIEDIGMGDKTNWFWETEKLDIDILPYDFSKIIFSPSGKQKLNLPTLIPGWQILEGQAENIRASLGQNKKAKWFFILDIQDGVIKNDTTNLTSNFGNFLLNVSQPVESKDTITLTTQLNDLDAAASEGELDYLVKLPVFQLAMSATKTKKFEEGPAIWSQEGGQLQIHRIIAQDTPAIFASKGTLNLDTDGYPAGNIDLHLEKPGNFLTTLRNSGFVTEEQADAATGAIALASLSTGGVLEKQIILRDGGIFVDGQRVADLEKIAP